VVDPDNADSTLSWNAFGGTHVHVTKTTSGLWFKTDQYWNGTETLTLVVADSSGLADSTRLFVKVIEVNDPPIITSVPDTLASLGSRYTFHVTASDPTDSLLTYSMSGPPWLRIDSIGTVQGRPADVGQFPIVVRVTDSYGASDSLCYNLSVTVLKSVAGLEEGIPSDFLMHQNYPNPFNPSTTIRFGLPERSHVRMEIYSIVGQRVEELLLSDLDAGYHEVIWRPTALASGAYIIVLEGKGMVVPGRDVRIVRKAVLVR
jgi:hypothetical protein